jgi:hypothetical protein
MSRGKEMRELMALFRRSGEEQKARLDRVLDAVFSIVRLLLLNRCVFAKAVEYQKTCSLKPQDSVVYALVISRSRTHVST